MPLQFPSYGVVGRTVNPDRTGAYQIAENRAIQNRGLQLQNEQTRLANIDTIGKQAEERALTDIYRSSINPQTQQLDYGQLLQKTMNDPAVRPENKQVIEKEAMPKIKEQRINDIFRKNQGNLKQTLSELDAAGYHEDAVKHMQDLSPAMSDFLTLRAQAGEQAGKLYRGTGNWNLAWSLMKDNGLNVDYGLDEEGRTKLFDEFKEKTKSGSGFGSGSVYTQKTGKSTPESRAKATQIVQDALAQKKINEVQARSYQVRIDNAEDLYVMDKIGGQEAAVGTAVRKKVATNPIDAENRLIAELGTSMRGSQSPIGRQQSKFDAGVHSMELVRGARQADGSYKINKPLYRELVSSLAASLGAGSSTSEADREGLIQNSLYQDVLEKIQYVMSKPNQTVPNEVVLQLKHMVKRQMQVSGKLRDEELDNLIGKYEDVLDPQTIESYRSKQYGSTYSDDGEDDPAKEIKDKAEYDSLKDGDPYYATDEKGVLRRFVKGKK